MRFSWKIQSALLGIEKEGYFHRFSFFSFHVGVLASKVEQ